jgi:hypothetical protein
MFGERFIMSSAIEVLKDIKESIEDSWKCRNKDYNTAIININISQVKYIEEAILALEQKKKLKEWLGKQIKVWKAYVKKTKDFTIYEEVVSECSEQRLWAYKEVLGELK